MGERLRKTAKRGGRAHPTGKPAFYRPDEDGARPIVHAPGSGAGKLKRDRPNWRTSHPEAPFAATTSSARLTKSGAEQVNGRNLPWVGPPSRCDSNVSRGAIAPEHPPAPADAPQGFSLDVGIAMAGFRAASGPLTRFDRLLPRRQGSRIRWRLTRDVRLGRRGRLSRPTQLTPWRPRPLGDLEVAGAYRQSWKSCLYNWLAQKAPRA